MLTREHTRYSGLWALAGSLALHGALLLLIARSEPTMPAVPAEQSGASITRVELFEVQAAPRIGGGAPRGAQEGAPPREVRAARVPKARAPEVAPGPPEVPPAPTTKEPDSVPETSPEPAQTEAVGAQTGAEAPVGSGVGTTGGDGTTGGPAGESGTGGPGQGSPGAAGGGDGDGRPAPAIAELHRRLAAAARHCYPEAARRFRTRGEVTLSFCLDAVGNATSITRASSSGSALLDRAAVDCVLPGALPVPGASGCYRVPVIFGPSP